MRAESKLCSQDGWGGGWGWTHTIACCLGQNKTPERHFIFLHRDQVGRGAEACGGEGLEEEEVEWAGPSLAGGGCASASGCRLHLGHVCGKHCRCRSWVPLTARGCKWQGEMWDGAELGPAASVYALREGSRRTEWLCLAESQLGAGVRREAGRDRRQSRAFPPSLFVLPCPWSDHAAWPWASFHLQLAAHPHPQQFSPHPSLLCSGGPGRVQIHFIFLFFFFSPLFCLKNNSKVPEKEVSMHVHAGVFGEGGNWNWEVVVKEGTPGDGLLLAPVALVRPSRLCGIVSQTLIPLHFCFQAFPCIHEHCKP